MQSSVTQSCYRSKYRVTVIYLPVQVLRGERGGMPGQPGVGGAGVRPGEGRMGQPQRGGCQPQGGGGWLLGPGGEGDEHLESSSHADYF